MTDSRQRNVKSLQVQSSPHLDSYFYRSNYPFWEFYLPQKCSPLQCHFISISPISMEKLQNFFKHSLNRLDSIVSGCGIVCCSAIDSLIGAYWRHPFALLMLIYHDWGSRYSRYSSSLLLYSLFSLVGRFSGQCLDFIRFRSSFSNKTFYSTVSILLLLDNISAMSLREIFR